MSITSIRLSGQQPAVTSTHPQYAIFAPVWQKLEDAYEGAGGFLDGTYLVAHPREWDDYTAATPKKPSKKLKARRAIARYENLAAQILNQLKSALFRGAVIRTIGSGTDTQDHPLATWWENVDGRRNTIDDYMSYTWTACGLYGHIAHLMERPEESEPPATQAEAGQPFLCTYTPLDIGDWIVDDYGTLTAVKLFEVIPRTDITLPARGDVLRVRYVTEDKWMLATAQGTATGQAASAIMDKEGDHGFGRLPVIFQYAKRRAMSTVMGQSILGDPQLYIDLYNLTSELRELLRNQTFSILNVVLGTGPDAMSVEKAVALLTAGGGTGTENVLFSAAASAYVTADAANVTAYQNERAQLMRTIYRLAGVPWEADSKDAEASGSLKLKREDMNQVLASYADECEKAEYQFVELWFRFHYPDTWQQELEDAEVVIRYPDSFDTTPFVELLEQAQAALTLNMDEMSPTFAVELRRRLVAKFMPDASEETTNAITAELEKSSQQLQAPGLAQKMAQLQKMYSMPPPPPNTRSLGTQSGDTGDVAA